MVQVPQYSTQRFRALACNVLLLSFLSFAAPAVAQAVRPPQLHIRPVAPHVFVLTNTGASAGQASNGVLVQTTQGLLAVDAAQNANQAEQLLRWVADSLHQRLRLLVLTHAQATTPEALAVLQQHRVKVYSSPLTAQRWQTGHPQAAALTPALQPYTVIRAGRVRLELFFPGPGFSPDNVVAWLPKYKVLFGGELVQAHTAAMPTNPAARKQWAATLRTVLGRYHRARVVVPAHGPVGSLTLVEDTRQLLTAPPRRKPTTVLSPAATSGRH